MLNRSYSSIKTEMSFSRGRNSYGKIIIMNMYANSSLRWMYYLGLNFTQLMHGLGA